MSSITNVNNNSSIVTVGRTTPVSPGQQPAEKSIPVVLASDQTAIPVEEQNKVQSEVALSLLGIPRAEVALGIFADVNTYDVNPSEWSNAPEFYLAGHGIKHLPNEAGALVEAPRNKTAVLTSKRFFRYQPGRVSAATFGIKSTISAAGYARNPVIRKYGIFDNFDGYYWETKNSGVGDNFSCVRRTQSVSRSPSTQYGVAGQTPKRGPQETGSNVSVTQVDDYRFCGQGEKEIASSPNLLVRDREILTGKRFDLVEATYATIVVAYDQSSNTLNIEGGGTFTGSGPDATDTNTVEGEVVNNYYYDLARGIYGTGAVGSAEDGGVDDGLELIRLVEEKCKRDADYWIDFFLQDMEWGGTAHTIWNLTNFTTALIPNFSAFEGAFYTQLSTDIGADPDLSAAAITKLQSLVGTVNSNLEASSNHYTTPVNWTGIAGFSYGSRGQIDTFYDVKKNYWGYFVSTFSDSGAATSNPYNDRVVSTYFDESNNPITDDTATAYTGKYGRTFTLAEVKYKCQRDIADFVVEGFKNDIAGGGIAETKYNMSMYYQDAGLSVSSQNVTEKPRHQYLKRLITFDLTDKLGYATNNTNYVKQEDLSDKVIANFDFENVETTVTGERGFAGNLVALRDGLIMVHAGVYDPNLLKEKKKIRVVCDTDNQLKLTEGKVTFGQHVRFAQAGDTVATIGGLEPGAIYQVDSVVGPKGNEFTLKSTDGVTAINFTQAQFATAEANGGNPANVFFETVVPFLMPDKAVTTGNVTYNGYDPDIYRPVGLGGSGNPIQESADPFPEGMMFPYQYSSDGYMPTSTADAQAVAESGLLVGFINTAWAITNQQEALELRKQIDAVNFIPEYINWVKNNVKPEFWGVYEYRVPRSRYSFDKLDGKSNSSAKHGYRVYSDVATGDTGIVRPGQAYAPGGQIATADSLYSFDFTKVTMLKIEFSWYGAVGALFLAYVPVDNGEARWVRVHHLRASNQLKIASLGNATLPITYNVYGGGDTLALGDEEESLTPAGANYETNSHNIVKYGASYYIDGGDRGTVRLYSHNNESLVPAAGKNWALSNGTSTYNAADPDGPAITLNLSGTSNDTINSTYFMGALLKTTNAADQNIRVIYANGLDSGSTGKLILSSAPQDTTVSNFTLIADRATNVYGLETKRVILSTEEGNAVRNRVQVYPTKMSTSNIGNNPVRLRMRKTPIFQTEVQPNGTLTIASLYDITSANLPLDVTESGGAGTYMANGEEIYGWFRALIDSTSSVTVFGRLYKEADEYYFDAKTTFSGVITLTLDAFLPDKRFDVGGVEYTTTTKVTEEKEGLSSILIATDPVVPIPGTGINVATVYLQQGTEQFDLASYFDYNKEYLSFPLTDTTESLYLAVDSDTAENDLDDNISIGITWEEQ